MSHSVLVSWALTAAINLAAPGSPPSLDRVADGVVTAAEENPAFAGEDGVAQTVAVLLAIAWRESGFKVAAAGDCPGLAPGSRECTADKRAQSLGLFQIGRGNAGWLGVSVADLTGEPVVQARIALRMVRTSFKICATRPLEERLGWFHHGHEGCSDSSAGRARMRLAREILRRWPAPKEKNLEPRASNLD